MVLVYCKVKWVGSSAWHRKGLTGWRPRGQPGRPGQMAPPCPADGRCAPLLCPESCLEADKPDPAWLEPASFPASLPRVGTPIRPPQVQRANRRTSSSGEEEGCLADAGNDKRPFCRGSKLLAFACFRNLNPASPAYSWYDSQTGRDGRVLLADCGYPGIEQLPEGLAQSPGPVPRWLVLSKLELLRQMAADDSEGKALMAEPVLGSSPEEREAVGPGAVPPCAPSRHDAEGEQPCGGPTAPAGRGEVGQGQVRLVVPSEGCLPQQGGPGLEAGSPTTESEEEARRHSYRTEEDGGHPVLGIAIPTVPSSELEGLLPRARDEDGGDPQGSAAVGNGQGLPLGEGAGAPVSFREDPAQCRGQQEEEEEEESKSCCIQAEEPSEEPECPICTELYDREDHCPAPLNCGHIICGRCLQAIMEAASAADIGRVRCPICRQKTPMMEWEICRLQEELLLLGAAQEPAAGGPTPLFFSPLPARRPGFWGGLEHHFQVRFHTTRMVGFLPCLRYPPRLIQGLAQLEGRCRWGYRLALVALMGAETLSLLLVFLPIALLLLLFLIMDQ